MSTPRFVTVAILLLASALPALAQASGPPPLVVKSARVSPKADGKLDEACWKEADWRPLQANLGGDLAVGGKVALCYDDRHLYAALRLDEPQPDRIKAEPGAVNGPEVWAGEILEWFINPAGEGRDFVQLGWNPAGARFNARCRASGPGVAESDLSWRPQWQAASTIGKAGWTSEAAIPFAELGQKPPAPGTRWTLNLCRTRQIGQRVFSALAPTGGGFHSPDRFLSVWFGKYAAPVETDQGPPTRILLGCHDAGQGYDALLEARWQLDRAFGEGNVDIRTSPYRSPMADWPLTYAGLKRYLFIVLVNVGPNSFTAQQVADLRRYVEEGGRLVTCRLIGVQAYSPKFTTWDWMGTPLKEFLPLEPSYKDGAWRKLQAVKPEHPLFAGIPLSELNVWTYGMSAKVLPGAEVLATARLDGGDGKLEPEVPFITEKRSGRGLVLDLNLVCSEGVTIIPIDRLKDAFLYSPYYPLFWDNVVRYVTGAPPPFPAKMGAPPARQEKPAFLALDVVRDNLGDLFAPGATVQLKSPVLGKPDYPYQVEVSIEQAGRAALPAGRYTLTEQSPDVAVPLPYLDRGAYHLRVNLRKGEALLDSTTARFAVTLPLLAADEFHLAPFITPDFMGEADTARVGHYLKELGFTQLKTLGGITYSGYRKLYRFYNETRFISRMQELGLCFRPVWYPLNLAVMTGAGDRDPEAPTPAVPAYPYVGKALLPWERHWLELFGERVYGRMPLTDGFVVNDEISAVSRPVTEGEQKGYQAATGRPAPTDLKQPEAYDFINYRCKNAADFTWSARAIAGAYEPSWISDSILTPNSFAGHTSCVINVPETAAALGATSPDEYHYGEPKLYQKSLSSMAIVWSATEFGRLAAPGFTGGQLSNVYYEAFPEQVFAALTGGAREFTVFHYNSASFEEHGRANKRFAEIARKTNRDAARIGRTLNHCDRLRGRVAVLYPHSAYTHLAKGQAFNADYLKMIGFSSQYIQLTYGVQLQYDLLRRLFGHVDILFDEQIRRGDLRHYDLFVLGYNKDVEERTLREIRRFAEQGGTILVSTDSGRLNEKQIATGTLYDLLPAAVGEEKSVPTDYSETRMSKREEWSRGHALAPKSGAEVLFAGADGTPACVRGAFGRGQAILLGMPLAGLKHASARENLKKLENLLSEQVPLVCRAEDGEFTAAAFLSRRGNQRLFMVANHNKREAATRILAPGDESERDHVLVDLVTGQRVPFQVEEGRLSFEATCADRWGRAFALLPQPPTGVEMSVSPPTAKSRKLMLAVRLVGKDGQPVPVTVPFDLTVTDSEGKVRDDLSGVRVTDRGVYVFAMTWPTNVLPGTWKVTAADRISGQSDSATWNVE